MGKFQVGDRVVINTNSINRNTRFTVKSIHNSLVDNERYWCEIEDGISRFGRWEEDLYWFPKEYLNKDRENK